jgi:D-amino peptidase
MRVLIMADMEGVSGIAAWDQVNGGAPMYEEGRRLYTEEINAAVRGAKAAGATDIVVVDCHGAGKDWTFNSLVHDLIDPDCTYVTRHPWGRYTEMFQEKPESRAGDAVIAGGGRADVAVMVGMHARAGTPEGVLCHTISTTTWRNLWFNDDLVGEFGINCALCGHYGVPVAVITGDEATCREGRALLGDSLAAVAVKKGLGRYSARHLPPVKARRAIEEGVAVALRDRTRWPAPYVPARPTTITVDLSTVDSANSFRGKKGVEIIEPLKVISRGKDWLEAWDNFWGW